MKKEFINIKIFYRAIFLTILILVPKVHFSQPVHVSVTATQNLSFGVFYPTGSGGTVIISALGARSSTGNVVLLGGGISSNATFEVTGKGSPNSITSITISNSTLTGSNGGTLSLNTFTTSPSPIINIKNRTATVNVGARLVVGTISQNPPGNYVGTFNVLFNYN